MDSVINFFSQPFVWGLCLGLFLCCVSVWGHMKTKREYRRYRRHLSDKLELEARQYELIRKEKDTLTRENENLRLRIGQLSEKTEQKVLRDLEILTRAEKRMMVQAPGFAGAWEGAKNAASEELTAEDSGRSLPRRLFSRLFGTGNAVRDALPENSAGNTEPSAHSSQQTQEAPSQTGPRTDVLSSAPANPAPAEKS